MGKRGWKVSLVIMHLYDFGRLATDARGEEGGGCTRLLATRVSLRLRAGGGFAAVLSIAGQPIACSRVKTYSVTLLFPSHEVSFCPSSFSSVLFSSFAFPW